MKKILQFFKDKGTTIILYSYLTFVVALLAFGIYAGFTTQDVVHSNHFWNSTGIPAEHKPQVFVIKILMACGAVALGITWMFLKLLKNLEK